MRTFTKVFLLACILMQTNLFAQDFTTKSLQNVGSTGWDILSDIAFDGDGNYYLAGSFSEILKMDQAILKKYIPIQSLRINCKILEL